MQKDKSILELMKKLDSHLKANSLKIVDYWKADLCAIGLRKENRLIYISTYNYLNNDNMRYDFDLELLINTNTPKSQIIKEGRAVNETKLITEICSFLANGVQGNQKPIIPYRNF
ncbi:hypothetical protein [Xanthocytophaga flava]|uniref:hypothetical protein n=1 Tax=Xanthocytophaga flava TaxID=3048013 RepID=UPI0028D67FFB|nr:hypothetical protein [Xanthocytophaga flavus]MDJ1471702.1 hypothetical protein [Xanthocytophaga flavus]